MCVRTLARNAVFSRVASIIWRRERQMWFSGGEIKASYVIQKRNLFIMDIWSRKTTLKGRFNLLNKVGDKNYKGARLCLCLSLMLWQIKSLDCRKRPQLDSSYIHSCSVVSDATKEPAETNC